MSGLLASIKLSHWTLISHNFLCVLAHSSLLHCRAVSYILSEPISHIHLLNVAHFQLFFPHNLHRGLWLVLLIWYFIEFVLMVCSCAAHNNASVSIFKSLLDNYCQVLSLSTLSGFSLTNCPCVFFSHHFCLSSCAFCFSKLAT